MIVELRVRRRCCGCLAVALVVYALVRLFDVVCDALEVADP